MLTPFGLALRKLRLEKGLRLLDLASGLGQSSAFISAVETGRRPIPAGYVEAISTAMRLNVEEAQTLQSGADQTRTEVSVDRLPAHQRELVAEFARRVETLPADVLDRIRRPVFKSIGAEVPFHRRRRGLLVAPTSTKILRQYADQVRDAFVPTNQTAFPIMDIVEFRLDAFFPGYYLDVCDRDAMGDDEGRVIAGQNCIMLRQDVYDGAWQGAGRFRFTVAHELGHFLMHREVAFARVREDDQPIYRDAEWQADEFAGGLLMSARHVRSFAGAEDAAQKCGISSEAARVMLSKHRKEGAM